MGACIYTRTGKIKPLKVMNYDSWAHDLDNEDLLARLLCPRKNDEYLLKRALLGEFKERFGISFWDFQRGKPSKNRWLIWLRGHK